MFCSCSLDKDTPISESYNSSLILYDNHLYPDFFLEYMENNNIDGDFFELYNNWDNVSEQDKIILDYIDSWKNEMDYSINNLKTIFNENELQNLIEMQNQWESITLELFELQYNKLKEMHTGSSNERLYFLELAQAYRERTIDIKFMLFLKETESDLREYSDKLDSIRFLYDEETS